MAYIEGVGSLEIGSPHIKEMWQQPKIKEGIPTKWGWMVQGLRNFSLGENTDIGFATYIQACAGVTIEDGVQIGSHVSIYSISSIDNKQGPVLIKKGAKVGAHSIIMPNVIIGTNTTIGMYSIIKGKGPLRMTIGDNCLIATHTVISQNIPDKSYVKTSKCEECDELDVWPQK